MKKRGFLKEHASLFGAGLRVGDAALIALTGGLAHFVYLGAFPSTRGYAIALILAMLLLLTLFPLFGLYRPWRGSKLSEEVWRLTVAWATVMALLTWIAFLTKTGANFSRGWFLIWLGLGWFTLVLERTALRSLLSTLRRRGYNQRRIVIVHRGALGAAVALGIEAAPWTGLRVTALFCVGGGGPSCAHRAAPVPGAQQFEGLAELVDFVKSEHIDQVWLALPLKDEDVIRAVLHLLRHSSVPVRYVPDISGLQLLNQSLEDVAGFPVLNLSGTHLIGVNRVVKALEDRILALLILLLTSPVLLAIAIGVKLGSPGPAIFRQRRLGIGGEEITVFKFRTMKLHDDYQGQVTQARRDDARITRFGAFLRRTSLDELPQFFNCLLYTSPSPRD